MSECGVGVEVRNAENTVQAEVRACAKALGQKGELERLKEKTMCLRSRQKGTREAARLKECGGHAWETLCYTLKPPARRSLIPWMLSMLSTASLQLSGPSRTDLTAESCLTHVIPFTVQLTSIEGI